MRNIYAHAYEAVDDERVWEIVTNDVPELQSFCEEQANAVKNDDDDEEVTL